MQIINKWLFLFLIFNFSSCSIFDQSYFESHVGVADYTLELTPLYDSINGDNVEIKLLSMKGPSTECSELLFLFFIDEITRHTLLYIYNADTMESVFSSFESKKTINIPIYFTYNYFWGGNILFFGDFCLVWEDNKFEFYSQNEFIAKDSKNEALLNFYSFSITNNLFLEENSFKFCFSGSGGGFSLNRYLFDDRIYYVNSVMLEMGGAGIPLNIFDDSHNGIEDPILPNFHLVDTRTVFPIYDSDDFIQEINFSSLHSSFLSILGDPPPLLDSLSYDTLLNACSSDLNLTPYAFSLVKHFRLLYHYGKNLSISTFDFSIIANLNTAIQKYNTVFFFPPPSFLDVYNGNQIPNNLAPLGAVNLESIKKAFWVLIQNNESDSSYEIFSIDYSKGVSTLFREEGSSYKDFTDMKTNPTFDEIVAEDFSINYYPSLSERVATENSNIIHYRIASNYKQTSDPSDSFGRISEVVIVEKGIILKSYYSFDIRSDYITVFNVSETSVDYENIFIFIPFDFLNTFPKGEPIYLGDLTDEQKKTQIKYYFDDSSSDSDQLAPTLIPSMDFFSKYSFSVTISASSGKRILYRNPGWDFNEI